IKRLIEVGALVRPGDPAFTLAETAHVKAVFGVPDVGLAGIRLGSPVRVTSDARPGVRMRGQVTAISPSADPKSRVFQVEVSIPNPRHRWKPSSAQQRRLRGDPTRPELDVGFIVTAAFAGAS